MNVGVVLTQALFYNTHTQSSEEMLQIKVSSTHIRAQTSLPRLRNSPTQEEISTHPSHRPRHWLTPVARQAHTECEEVGARRCLLEPEILRQHRLTHLGTLCHA